MNVLWRPNPGPQNVFLGATEFEVLYGGQAGGGKSDALMFGGLRYVQFPSYRALLIRRTLPDLQELIDRAQVFKKLGAIWNENKKRFVFPSGAIYQFGYFRDWADREIYQGKEFQYIGWDELGTCPEERFWTFLMSRCRTASDLIVPMMRASANPGGEGHAWIKRRFIEVCGEHGERIHSETMKLPDGREVTLSRRFIPARLADNPFLDKNDPMYRARLMGLPEVLRAQLLEGDWSAASGMALGQLNRKVHLVRPFPLPPHWRHFESMDWGYNHPTSWGEFAAGPEKLVVLRDSLRLWRKSPGEIALRIQERRRELARLDDRALLPVQYTVAGHDCWADVKARGENVPTIAEQLAKLEVPLMKANISRVSGLNNMRAYLEWLEPGTGEKKDPLFLIFDTPANRVVYDTLESMVTDPNDAEDALKVDVDDFGEGGDDAYDMVRYGLASRPLAAANPFPKSQKDRNHHDGLKRAIDNHPANRRNRRHRRRFGR